LIIAMAGWRLAEMTAARSGGRFLGSTRRHDDRAAVDGRHASPASAIEASSAVPATKLDGSV